MACLNIWEWNCASFNQRRAVLEQILFAHENRPQILLLQETLVSEPKIRGYRTVSARGEGRGVAIFVDKKLSFREIDLKIGRTNIEHNFIELIPNHSLKNSVFILNIYSSPKQTSQSFLSMLNKATSIADKSPLIIGGDFNARHTDWGYPNCDKKGTQLRDVAEKLSLQLVTDPMFPTRKGNSVSSDTTPDLTFCKNISDVDWLNTQKDLGSDHFILHIKLRVGVQPLRQQRITDWEQFRKIRKERDEPPPRGFRRILEPNQERRQIRHQRIPDTPQRRAT